MEKTSDKTKPANRPYKITIAVLSVILAAILALQLLYVNGTFAGKTENDPDKKENTPDKTSSGFSLSHEGYELEQVVILSRHNIRSPLSGGDSLLGTITPNEWFRWSSSPSELSLRGGALETLMGQYFRKWLEAEKLFPENYRPEGEEVRIYSNSKQRTIATAKYFSAGLLPASNTEVEYHMEFDKMDPVFTPQFTYISDKYVKDAEAQIKKLFSEKIAGLKDNYELISDVIDMKNSPAWKDGKVTDLVTDDLALILKEYAEPGMSGSLKTACSVSDALVLQYYEETDAEKAAFGHDLSFEQWKAISEIKDLYGDVLFTAPLVCVNVAHPLLSEIEGEMNAEGRKFTFLCGHDSNVGSVLAALEAEEYELPEAIESKTPIGCKLVFSKWKNASGERFYSVDLVYQSVGQLRGLKMLDLDNPPVVYPVAFKGMNRNADGLYPEISVNERFKTAIAAYDDLTRYDTLRPAA